MISLSSAQTELSTFHAFPKIIQLQTHACLEFIDLTEDIRTLVLASGIKDGMVNVQTRHTTAAVIINEKEPLLLQDLRMTLEQLAPRNRDYRHDDFSVRTVNLTPDEMPNGHAHCKALFLRSSETVNVVNGEMQLGVWQRIFFIELDRPRERAVSVLAMGT